MIAALAINPFMNFLRRFRRHIRKVELTAGGLLVATGLMIFFNKLGEFSYLILEAFPALGTIG